jgi:drug/metabolite transporter (DMT)-like permease
VTGGYLFLFGSLAGFSLLGILHKVADHPSCRPRMITMLLLSWGAVLTAAYAAAFDARGLRMPGTVLGMGAAAGAAASLALFAFQASLRYGKISTSWLVLNLCVAVPLLISIVVYGEALTASKGVGVAMVFAAILLMWWDKRIDLARAGAGGAAAAAVQAEDAGAMVVATTAAEAAPAHASRTHATRQGTNAGSASKPKWLSLIMLAFLANGLAASSQKVLVELGDGDFAWQFYVVLYAAGALVVAVANALNSGLPNRREALVSAGMAVASVTGNICIVKALGLQVPGTIAYPVANGGSLFLVVLAGFLAIHERVSPAGVAGIALGIAATLVLVLS